MLNFNILLDLLEKTSFIIVILLMVSRIKPIKRIFQREDNSAVRLLFLSLIFSVLGIIGTYSGINVLGSYANVRNIAIISGGILYGPAVGISSGIVAGLHRYLIDVNGITSLPCLMTSVLAGIVSSFLYNRVSENYKAFVGIVCGLFIESISMALILLISKPYNSAVAIVGQIYFPMLAGQIGIGLFISILQNTRREKDEVAAYQSKLALDIANKTLPYFRDTNDESLKTICRIIKEEINSDAVAITDVHRLRAYSGIREDFYYEHRQELSSLTKEAIKKGDIVYLESYDDAYLKDNKTRLKTAMIIPLKERDKVVGTLKIYYCKQTQMTDAQRALAIGLSQIISTLLEVSKVEDVKREVNKAKIKALQSQINPHFLFNALNTIISFIRINPDKARELIIDLSTYIRYNLEFNDSLIDIQKEIEQVKAYVAIEKARFGDNLQVIYDIDEIDAKIPSLVIQPLVENAIIHGIRNNNGKGTVWILIKNTELGVKVTVENDGVSIDEEVIDKVYSGQMPENKIGLYNVYLRLKLMYGRSLDITRLEQGTRIEFYI